MNLSRYSTFSRKGFASPSQVLPRERPRERARKQRRNPPRRAVRPRAFGTEGWVETSALVGRYLTLFVLFASTMNWWYYRSWRKNIESRPEDKTKPKK